MRAVGDWLPGFLGTRRAPLLAHAISDRNARPICSTYVRRIPIDVGEDPAALQLVIDAGCSRSRRQGTGTG